MEGIQIREGALTAASFANLRAACGLSVLEERMVEQALRASLITLTAQHGARVVGMVRVVGDGSFIFLLYDLLVVPPWRRRGIGSLLTREALLRSGRFVPKGHWVTMSLFSAEDRETFYRRLGFMDLPAQGLGAGMQMMYRSGEPLPDTAYHGGA